MASLTHPKIWSTEEVVAHLQQTGKVSESVLTLLRENNISGREFLILDKESLKDLGLSAFHCIRVLSIIQELQELAVSVSTPSHTIQPNTTTTTTTTTTDQKYKRIKKLGQGAFGTTYLAEDTQQNRKVVVKDIQYKSDAEVNTALAEATVVQKLQHDHVLKGLDLFLNTTTKCLSIVLEYCELGDLAEYLKTSGPLDRHLATKWLYQIASAVRYIHAENVIHRDIKPSNIMLTCAPNALGNSVKLGDFGLSSTMEGTMVKSVAGTFVYMAPEVFQGKYNKKADLWSCGVVALEMTTGKPPLGALQSMSQVDAAVKKIPSGFSPAYSEVVQSLLVPHAPDRIDATGLAALDLFAEFRPVDATSKGFVSSSKLIIQEARELYHQAVAIPEPCSFLKYGPHPDTFHVHVARCNVDNTPEAAVVVANLFDRSGGSNSHLLSSYRIVDMVFIKGTMRAVQLHNKANELATKYGTSQAITATFRLSDHGETDWQRCVRQRFDDAYSSGIVKRYGPHVTLRLAYHVAPSREIAEKIIAGNFAILAKTDAGFFAQGLYFSLDANYALQYYTPATASEAVLLVCLVCTGNSHPVTDMSFLGKPLLPKADSHIAVVAQKNPKEKVCYPVEPTSWNRYEKDNQLFTEVVVRDESQVLPLLLVSLKGGQQQKTQKKEKEQTINPKQQHSQQPIEQLLAQEKKWQDQLAKDKKKKKQQQQQQQQHSDDHQQQQQGGELNHHQLQLAEEKNKLVQTSKQKLVNPQKQKQQNPHQNKPIIPPNAVLRVSGAGSEIVNGYYQDSGNLNGHPKYSKADQTRKQQ